MGQFRAALGRLPCAAEELPGAFILRPPLRQFDISQDCRQQIVEIVGYSSGHLTDRLHLLRLTEGGLGLFALAHLDAQPRIRILKLSRALDHKALELGRDVLPLQEISARIVLPAPRPEAGLDRAQKRDRLDGPLQQRHVPKRRHQPFHARETGKPAAACQKDDRHIGPRRLAIDPGQKVLIGEPGKSLFRNEDGSGSFSKRRRSF